MRLIRLLVFVGTCFSALCASAQGLQKYQQVPIQENAPASAPRTLQPSPGASPAAPSKDIYARFREYARTLDDAGRLALEKSLADKERTASEKKRWSEVLYYARLRRELDQVGSKR